MWKKVPDPADPGSLIDARPIEVIGGNLSASITADLADGTKIILNIQFAEISLIEGRKDSEGKPVYNVDTSGQIRVVPPPEGGTA